MTDKWLVKRKHYSGGESVISWHLDLAEANEVARNLNAQYQAGNYYVEEWDERKVEK